MGIFQFRIGGKKHLSISNNCCEKFSGLYDDKSNSDDLTLSSMHEKLQWRIFHLFFSRLSNQLVFQTGAVSFRQTDFLTLSKIVSMINRCFDNFSFLLADSPCGSSSCCFGSECQHSNFAFYSKVRRPNNNSFSYLGQKRIRCHRQWFSYESSSDNRCEMNRVEMFFVRAHCWSYSGTVYMTIEQNLSLHKDIFIDKWRAAYSSLEEVFSRKISVSWSVFAKEIFSPSDRWKMNCVFLSCRSFFYSTKTFQSHLLFSTLEILFFYGIVCLLIDERENLSRKVEEKLWNRLRFFCWKLLQEKSTQINKNVLV